MNLFTLIVSTGSINRPGENFARCKAISIPESSKTPTTHTTMSSTIAETQTMNDSHSVISIAITNSAETTTEMKVSTIIKETQMANGSHPFIIVSL